MYVGLFWFLGKSGKAVLFCLSFLCLNSLRPAGQNEIPTRLEQYWMFQFKIGEARSFPLLTMKCTTFIPAVFVDPWHQTSEAISDVELALLWTSFGNHVKWGGSSNFDRNISTLGEMFWSHLSTKLPLDDQQRRIIPLLSFHKIARCDRDFFNTIFQNFMQHLTYRRDIIYVFYCY